MCLNKLFQRADVQLREWSVSSSARASGTLVEGLRAACGQRERKSLTLYGQGVRCRVVLAHNMLGLMLETIMGLKEKQTKNISKDESCADHQQYVLTYMSYMFRLDYRNTPKLLSLSKRYPTIMLQLRQLVAIP